MVRVRWGKRMGVRGEEVREVRGGGPSRGRPLHGCKGEGGEGEKGEIGVLMGSVNEVP